MELGGIDDVGDEKYSLYKKLGPNIVLVKARY